MPIPKRIPATKPSSGDEVKADGCRYWGGGGFQSLDLIDAHQAFEVLLNRTYRGGFMTKSRIVALIAAGSLTAFAAGCSTASNDNNMNANANKAANTAMNQNAAANNANAMAQNANAKAANANANAKAANANAKVAPAASAKPTATRKP